MIGDNYRHPCVSCNTEIGSHDSPSTYHCMECFMKGMSAKEAPQERHYETHQRASRALDVQEGGDHYKTKGIQPIEYIFANEIGFAEGNVIKYVSRWKDKGGVEDLKKARHYLDLLIEAQEKN